MPNINTGKEVKWVELKTEMGQPNANCSIQDNVSTSESRGPNENAVKLKKIELLSLKVYGTTKNTRDK